MACPKVFWFLLAVLLSTTSSQIVEEDSDLIEKFNEIFNMQDTVIVPSTQPTVSKDQYGVECMCVPFYMCNEEDDSTDLNIVINVRMQKETCQSSVEVCCPLSNVIEKAPNPDKIKNAGCGTRNENGLGFKITGSLKTESQFGEFPWTVSILKLSDGSAFCGGSLIHPRVVLTAAHCLNNIEPTEVKVRAGEWDTQTTKEPIPFQERTVSFFIKHPAHNKRNLANDIALVFLSGVFNKANNINTVCLPNSNQLFDSNKNCIATGWGTTNFNLKNRYAVIMKKITMDIVDYNTCNSAFKNTQLGKRFRLHHSFLCAGGAPGKDMCEGDGGGPFVCALNEDRYYQVGITSWGIGCNNNIPGAYTYVSRFRTWIDLTMTAANLDSSSYIS